MKKTELPKLDLSVYEETLENGLKVYVIPNSYAKGVYATFTVKYGGGIDEFVPYGEKEYVKFPHGIAHFLEHKLFEQEDGTDPMQFFSERGADCNAFTNSKCTCYLFSGSNAYKENIRYLLDYVQAPYFTDENVKKEKGIIVQEAKMYLDHPGRVMYYETMEQLLVKDPNRYSTIGTIEEINSITKEQLYQCYYTFYHPSNMLLVISGNVKPEEMIELVKENQNKKVFPKKEEIKVKKEKEPYQITEKEVIKYMNVQIPKVSVNIKINIKKLKEQFTEREINYYVSMMLGIHFSSLSLLQERLEKEHIINGGIGGMAEYIDDYLLVTFDAETKEKDKFIESIIEELKDVSITEEEFIREQRVRISSCYKASDSIYSMNDTLRNQIVKYDTFFPNTISEIKNLKYENISIVKKIFDDYKMGIVLILPNEKTM